MGPKSGPVRLILILLIWPPNSLSNGQAVIASVGGKCVDTAELRLAENCFLCYNFWKKVDNWLGDELSRRESRKLRKPAKNVQVLETNNNCKQFWSYPLAWFEALCCQRWQLTAQYSFVNFWPFPKVKTGSPQFNCKHIYCASVDNDLSTPITPWIIIDWFQHFLRQDVSFAFGDAFQLCYQCTASPELQSLMNWGITVHRKPKASALSVETGTSWIWEIPIFNHRCNTLS